MHHLSEDLAKLFKDQDTGQTAVKIDVTTDGLSINVFDRSQKPIFNPGTDVFTDYGGVGVQHAGLGNRPLHAFQNRTRRPHRGPSTNATPREAVHKWELSTERANAARRKVVDGGVGTSQICKVSGFADTVPMPDTAPTDEANRRVTVLVKVKDSINNLPEAISSDIAK